MNNKEVNFGIIKTKILKNGKESIEDEKIQNGDNIEININITDVDNTILINYLNKGGIKHALDGNEIYIGDEKTYTYTLLIENQLYGYQTIVYWNDGFDNQILEYTGKIQLQNQKPTIDPIIEYINNTKNNLKIVPNAFDPENDLNYVKYDIFIRKETIFEQENETEYTWVYLNTLESNILDYGVFIDFYKSGNFKINIQAWDNSGLSSDVKELFIDIECKTGGKDTCSGYFDWSKTTSMLKFKIEESNLKFKIEEEQIKFTVKEEQVKFTMTCPK